MKDDFDKLWKQAMENASKRVLIDDSYMVLTKRYKKAEKRLEKIGDMAQLRQDHIIREEMKKLLTVR